MPSARLSVCMFFCLSAGISQKPHVPISRNFLYVLPVAIAWSSHRSKNRSVGPPPPVLWMTLCFKTMGPMGQNQGERCFVEFARWWHQSDVRQRRLVEFSSWRHRGQSCCLRLQSFLRWEYVLKRVFNRLTSLRCTIRSSR